MSDTYPDAAQLDGIPGPLERDAARLAAITGPTGWNEFQNAPDHIVDGLAGWLYGLPWLSDRDFAEACVDAIQESEWVASWRGNWAHLRCKNAAMRHQALLRHKRAGHSEKCSGDTLYGAAAVEVQMISGRDTGAHPPRPCDCGADQNGGTPTVRVGRGPTNG